VLISYTQEEKEKKKNTTHEETYHRHNIDALRIVQRKRKRRNERKTTVTQLFRISTLLFLSFFFSPEETRRRRKKRGIVFFLFSSIHISCVFFPSGPLFIHSYLIIRKNEYRTTSSFSLVSLPYIQYISSCKTTVDDKQQQFKHNWPRISASTDAYKYSK
jgi:hypothetical protein